MSTSGFINVLKPAGMTSHDVVSFIRRTYSLKKVGHAGTLDPAAAGVLPIALGSATRLIEYITDADKGYRAELTFGYKTDSGDDMGEVIEQINNFKIPSQQEIDTVLKQFIGRIQQVPPMYSAIKVNGQKLYELARQGKSIEVPTRLVEISTIKMINNSGEKLLFDVTCSKGTYIRTLCMDIGAKLNLPAVMSFLIRTRVGKFTLQEAVTLEEIAADPQKALQNVHSVLNFMPKVILTKEHSLAFSHGQIIKIEHLIKNSVIAVYNENENLIGIGSNVGQSLLKPVKVFNF